jgi:hypothetical protein
MSEGYEPRWDIDMTLGKDGEAFMAEYLGSLVLGRTGHLTTEVKRDRQALMTGNVWIELECRRSDGWHLSGVNTSEADWWTLVLADRLILGIPTTSLRRVARELYDFHDSYGKWRFRSEEKDGSHPTRGVRVPIDYFLMRLRMEFAREVREA